MSLKITVHTDKFAELPWPHGVPLPAAGDSVVLAHAGSTISFVVDQRSFEVGADSPDATGIAHIIIEGHHPTSGSV